MNTTMSRKKCYEYTECHPDKYCMSPPKKEAAVLVNADVHLPRDEVKNNTAWTKTISYRFVQRREHNKDDQDALWFPCGCIIINDEVS